MGGETAASHTGPSHRSLPTAGSFLPYGTHMHVCGHPAPQPSSIFMPCTQLSLGCPQGSLRSAVHTRPENRPRAEATWAGSKRTIWAGASRVTGMGTVVLKVANRFFPLALLIPHPIGRAVARAVPS